MTNITKYLRLNIQREVLLLFVYTFLSNLALINSGATMGYSAIALPLLTTENITESSINLNSEEKMSFFASVVTIGEICGCLLCLVTVNYGRRCTMIVCGVNYSFGWFLIAGSYNIIQLFIGRMLTGIAIGLNTPTIEIYLSEISTDSWKEAITVTTSIALNVGILTVYIIGYVIHNNWRLVAAFFIIPSMTFVIFSILFIHESPRWLLSNGRKEEARIALLRIRGLRQETIKFQEEFAKMVNCNESTNNFERSRTDSSSTVESKLEKSFLISRNFWSMLENIRRAFRLPEVKKPYIILNFYFLFQQFSGLYVIIYYTVDLITRIHITIDPFFITVMIGVFQLMGSLIAACSSKRIGRRVISIVSGTGISISLGILAMYLHLFEDTGIVTVPLVCILFYVAFGSFGFFTIPWSMIQELYPTKYLNILSQLTVLFTIFCNCITIQLYPVMVIHARNATFYFYCIISILATAFVTSTLPETKGKTKAQIEEEFNNNVQINGTFKKIEDVY